ncbi:MAG TPA: hypothetical protein DEF39_09215 [Hungateiclostridium thermocellum]|jgi:LuxR family maltose regulon positive regulatory protein|uniref:hypothetical protein n=1 Tax=Acetivibrio thermocellus TaxID=1515 RepID=UPI00003C8EC8|nr:hypothetical protein [Acetivibrio thermocellus]NLU28125.1 hypothetical protein [Acetivibrio thermocellus]THJ78559.1 hypothetical protein EPD62_05690 [Acetivibrio thermocellus]UWV47727.1 hypothetical protein N1236_04235 [Acetivibrio thermocellus]HBW27428.1 hypothetical protein [Acetivibrio thermocellus]
MLKISFDMAENKCLHTAVTQPKKVYINTLGAFYIAPAHDRCSRVKIRTQKSRELLAYLLEHREDVSRERIFADL